MRTFALALLLVLPAIVFAAPGSVCPVSHGEELFDDPPFGFPYWYGTEALAASIPPNGIWPTTHPGHLIAVKLFWWSPALRPGSEKGLEVEIKNIFDDSVTADWGKPTNAGEFQGDGWTMLVGIDFQDEGCWQITGTFLGQSLTFVVETVDYAKHMIRSAEENPEETDTEN